MVLHTAHIVNPFRRPPAWQSRQSTRKQTHSTCSRWHFQFSHDTTSTIEIQHRRRYENVTDYCPHSYSYRMFWLQFIFHIARFLIWHAVLVFTIELHRIFDTIKRAKTSGSLHCCLLVGNIWYPYRHLLDGTVRCLKPAWRVCTHTADLFSLVCCSCIHCWTCPHLCYHQ